jgi:hypothetical protein
VYSGKQDKDAKNAYHKDNPRADRTVSRQNKRLDSQEQPKDCNASSPEPSAVHSRNQRNPNKR